MNKNRWLRVRITSQLADALKAEAEDAGMNVSEYVRFILQSWVMNRQEARLVDTRAGYEVE